MDGNEAGSSSSELFQHEPWNYAQSVSNNEIREPSQAGTETDHINHQPDLVENMDTASHLSEVDGTTHRENRTKKRKRRQAAQSGSHAKRVRSLPRKTSTHIKDTRYPSNREQYSNIITTDDPQSFEMDLNMNRANVPNVIKAISRANMSLNNLNILRRSKFIKEHISTYCKEIRYEERVERFREYEETICGISELFRILLRQLPSSCDDIHPTLTFMQSTSQTLLRRKLITDGKLDAIQTLNEMCEDLVENRRKKKITVEDIRPPPDDFRTINVFPTMSDIRRRGRPYLRKNKIEGAYADIDHYLDVHFRLLREDCLRHLIDGIKTYRRFLKSGNREANTDIRIYTSVNIIKSFCNNDGLCYRIHFQKGRHRKIQWRFSKRLIFGTLVCLSSDGFESDFIFATVQNRDSELLEQGCLDIRIENSDGQLRKLESTEQFVMAESTTYFEPYRHVLEGLQGIRVLPFERYIIQCEKNISCPKYSMTKSSGELTQEQAISTETAASTSFTFDQELRVDTPVEPDYTVPSRYEVHLDETQYRAFQTALTKEFAIIQGPPGTGKTYVGLKIVRTLLKWHFETDSPPFPSLSYGAGDIFQGRRSTIMERPHETARESPILVVCYTNHALDQFLEGILLITQQIVRVGGRSKSQKLEQKNIKNYRFHKRSGYVEKNARARIKGLRSQLANIDDCLSFCNQGVLSINALKKAAPEDHRSLLESFTDDDFLHWLEVHQLQSYEESAIIPHRKQQPRENTPVNKQQSGDYFTSQRSDHVLDLDNPTVTNEEDMAEHVAAERVDLALYIGETFYNTKQDLDMRNQTEYNRWLEDQNCFMYAKRQLTQINQTNANIPMDIWQICNEERWMLYRFWRERHRKRLLEERQNCERRYKIALTTLEDIQLKEDIDILKNKKVLGMTTTGAAKFRKVLQKLKPKVIVVEEAAEVLEAHIISTLSTSCEHLILIGDHKQLRPNPAVYDLAEYYNLKISLFERLIRNGIPYETLLYQRRMRPDIARLLKNIYPELKDHNSVEKYGNVRGVIKNCFFLNHNKEENQDVDTELNSPSNKHEAAFLGAFCRYLLNQGYKESQITILTPYIGQVKLIQQYISHDTFPEIKISTIDNYQGEENDLVLLSLVRSNKDDKIGFLKDENRLCVSVSRARYGLYVIGNFDLLGSKSQLWDRMIESAKEGGCYGTYIPLVCQNHPDDDGIEAQEADDFKKAPEGGCLKPCRQALLCGHACVSVCHSYDVDHTRYKCREICGMIICDEHETTCTDVCFNPECSTCMEPVERERPDCKHIQPMKCGESLQNIQCKEKCKQIVKCGHVCPRKCHVDDDPEHIDLKCQYPCTKMACETHETKCTKICHQPCSKCIVPVKKELPGCKHVQKVPCGQSLSIIRCDKRCEYRLNCGHVCSQKCHFYNDPEHETHTCKKPCYTIICERHQTQCENQCYGKCSKCTKIVSKKMTGCDHLQRVKCFELLGTNVLCRNPCGKLLACGHICSNLCFEPCVRKSACTQFKTVTLQCGHEKIQVQCRDDPKEIECNAPCEATLKCGHECQGECGKCFAGRLHQSCKSKCTRTLVCDHKCSSFCTHSCPSCERKCANRCSHSQCPKRCGQSCPPCKEPCEWSCEHQTCKNKCHEPCDRDRCDEPCKEKLRCGHECIGLCGEPCPNKCIICHREEVTEIFFGTEEEPDSRFIQLSECKHIFEVSGLDHWMEQKTAGDQNVQIQMKKCPKCNTIIRRSFRYGNIIKKALGDIELVKSKLIHGSSAERTIRRENLLSQTRDRKFISLLKTDIPYNQLCCLEMVIPLTNHITNKLGTVSIKCTTNYKVISFMRYLNCQYEKLKRWAQRERNRLSEQERSEAQVEINRLDSYFQVARWLRKVEDEKVTLSNTALRSLKRVKSELFTNQALDPDNGIIPELKAAIDKQVGVLNITKEEQLQLLQWGQANGLRKGSWYKCPNGHIYTIGECGGAMESSKCPECKADIGGSHHTLTDGNTVATVMDGARHAAWSDQANMDNYDLDNVL